MFKHLVLELIICLHEQDLFQFLDEKDKNFLNFLVFDRRII